MTEQFSFSSWRAGILYLLEINRIFFFLHELFCAPWFTIETHLEAIFCLSKNRGNNYSEQILTVCTHGHVSVTSGWTWGKMDLLIQHNSFVLMLLCSLSDYGGSSTAKYQTFNPSFSSKSSYMYSGSKTMVSSTLIWKCSLIMWCVIKTRS